MAIIKDIVTILALIGVAWTAIFIYFKFAPVIKINISDKWVNDNLVILRIEIENVSKVRVAIKKEPRRKENANILFQIFRHNITEGLNLTEFLPFTKKWFDKKGYPSSWKEPEIIFETTEWIYPGETIAIERPISTDKGDMLHVGVQVHAKFGRLEFAKKRHWEQRWTTTRFIKKNV